MKKSLLSILAVILSFLLPLQSIAYANTTDADQQPNNDTYNSKGSSLSRLSYTKTLNRNSDVSYGVVNDNGKLRIRGIKVSGPVRVHVYDSKGGHLGPLPDGVLDMGIEGAQYEIVGNGTVETYIALYDNDTYIIQIDGYADGYMNIKDEIINSSPDTQVIESCAVFKNISVNSSMKASFDTVPTQSPTKILIDNNGDGKNDITKYVSVFKDSSCKNDKTPPSTAYKIKGTLGKNNWYTSDLSVTLIPSDTGGGAVADTRYSIDQGASYTYYVPFAVSQEGNYNLNIYSEDTLRNCETEKHINVKIDKTAPDIFLSNPQNPRVGDMYTLNCEAYDTISGVASIILTVDDRPAKEGQEICLTKKNTKVKAICYDNAGNKSEKMINIHVEDNLSPISSVKLEGVLGKFDWYTSDVKVSINAVDRGYAGVDKIYYKLNNGVETKYTSKFIIRSEGSNTLEFYSKDKAGNIEEIRTMDVDIDKSLPIISENRPADTEFVSSIGSSFDCTDLITGLNKVEYALSRSSSQPTSWSEDFDASDEEKEGGTWYLFIRAYDLAGNKQQKMFTYKIDTTAPSVNVDKYSSGWSNKDIKVAPKISDTKAGLKNIRYCWVDNPDNQYNWMDYNKGMISQTNNGIWYLTIRAEDKVGNTITKTFGPYKIDKTAASINVSKINNGETNKGIGITPLISDEQSGIRSVNYAWSINTDVPLKWNTYTKGNIKQEKNGVWYLFVKVKDLAGNEIIKYFGPFKIDIK